MVQTGVVLKTEGGRAVVRIRRGAGCGSCGSSCGMSDESESRVLDVTVLNEIGAKPGDHVELSLGSGELIGISALTYLMPLGFLFVGALLGKPFSGAIGWPEDPDLAAAFFGFVFLIISFTGLWAFMRRKKSTARITPKITKVVPAPEQCSDPEHRSDTHDLGRLNIKLNLPKKD